MLATAWGLWRAPLAVAQHDTDAFLNQQRALEEDVRNRLERELPADQKFNLDWGGWYSSWLFLFDDGVNSSRTLRRNDLRLWGGATVDQGAHEIYARMRLSFLDFNHGDSFDGNEDDVDGPNLERGYYQFDLQRAIAAYGGQHTENNFKLKIGRDLVEFGTGYVLALPMDHVLLTAEIQKLELTGLIGKSISSTDDIDRTRPAANEMRRNFWGVQARYKGWEKHQPFAYVLWNDDQLNDSFRDSRQRHQYDSFYTGVGMSGEPVKNLYYGTEWVIERGKSYGDGNTSHRDDIKAWAFDAMLEYTTELPGKPRFVGEYIFASGDSDRWGSPTDAQGGNRRGNDESFVGFGWRDTGLSFAPRMSNIHIWRLGGAFLPFENVETLKAFELGTDWYLYSKHRRSGAVSDWTADERTGYLGWEMDYYANWRITSDLTWTTRYGIFFPGDAFSDQTTRTYWVTGITWSF